LTSHIRLKICQRAESIEVFRLWRDSGYGFGAILSGILADLLGINFAVIGIGALTLISAGIIQLRMSCNTGNDPRLTRDDLQIDLLSGLDIANSELDRSDGKVLASRASSRLTRVKIHQPKIHQPQAFKI
jgi:hypothetical protein